VRLVRLAIRPRARLAHRGIRRTAWLHRAGFECARRGQGAQTAS
jgi:hypothetical protein